MYKFEFFINIFINFKIDVIKIKYHINNIVKLNYILHLLKT